MTLRAASLFTLLLAFMLSTTGCKKDEFVNSTMDEVTQLATEIADTVTKADDKKQGVADAQKLLDSKKGELAKKMNEVGQLRGIQVSEEVMASMQTKITEAVATVFKLKVELMGESMKDPELSKAVDKLTDDFKDTIMPESP